jgi:hypothetical protein
MDRKQPNVLRSLLNIHLSLLLRQDHHRNTVISRHNLYHHLNHPKLDNHRYPPLLLLLYRIKISLSHNRNHRLHLTQCNIISFNLNPLDRPLYDLPERLYPFNTNINSVF